MFRSFKAATLVAVSCLVVAGMVGSAAAPAFGAAEADGASSLLPASVVAAASAEAQSASHYNFIPEAPVEADEAEPAATSLRDLVEANLSSDTDNREEECLAAATYFEAKSEPLEGQLAVAKVVLNRAKSGRFPSTVCGVVFQRGQFHFVRGGGFPPIAKSSRDWREAVAIAHIARENLWDSRMHNAMYFHATRVRPGWRLARLGTVGNHVFYR